ncbi:MAG: hypothetical protein K6A61_03430 [Butyrivibrio sp.]|nr:hypothetical protein [Butyrivibrio sp.]
MRTRFLAAVFAVVMAITLFGDNVYASEKGKEKAESNKQTYYLSGLKKGDIIMWDVCSQCANTFSVTIKDDNKTYASIDKEDYVTEVKMLSHESALYEGGRNLRIEVEFTAPDVTIKTATASGAIKNEQKKTIGYLYNYSLEDGTDADYNDVSVSVTSWKKQG